MNDASIAGSSRNSRGVRPIVWFALLVTVVGSALLWYAIATGRHEDREREALVRRIAALEETQSRLLGQIESLTRRFDDVAALDRSLREELLGLGERAALLEQAIGRVLGNRMDSVADLHLNQAELLLSSASERLALFHDVDAALAALRLADGELASLGDPRFSGVRQTLAQEIAALEALPRDGYGDALVTLAELRARVATLPIRRAPVPSVPNVGGGGRLESLLRGLIQIRRITPPEAARLDLLGADTVRAVVTLDLLHAEEALRRNDGKRYQALIGQARAALVAGFDLDAPTARDLRPKLDSLANLHPTPWPELGAALAQLVNLRHAQQIARGVER